MKIVRKLLRLMPIIVFIGGLIYFTYASKEQYSTIYELEGTNPLVTYYDALGTIYSDYGDRFFDMAGINQSINDFISSTLQVNYSNVFPIDFILSILIYELFLSFMFLIFDVFNFMLTIASNWLRKGEKLNE